MTRLLEGDDPSLYLWKLAVTGRTDEPERAVLRVAQTDSNFLLGATYYIVFVATTPANVIVDVELK